MTLGIALERPGIDYPPLRQVSEAALFHAYARGTTPVVYAAIRTEACACGGELAQLPSEEPDDVVRAHNATIGHVAWSAQTRLVP